MLRGYITIDSVLEWKQSFSMWMLDNAAEHQFTTWEDGVPNTIDTFVTNDDSKKDIKLLPLSTERYSRQAAAAEGIYC